MVVTHYYIPADDSEVLDVSPIFFTYRFVSVCTMLLYRECALHALHCIAG